MSARAFGRASDSCVTCDWIDSISSTLIAHTRPSGRQTTVYETGLCPGVASLPRDGPPRDLSPVPLNRDARRRRACQCQQS
jgi:hypothetical protein